MKTMIQPKISVVAVCYNAVNDIEETNFSVRNLLVVKSWNSMLVIFKEVAPLCSKVFESIHNNDIL